MTKVQARQLINGLNLPTPQANAAMRTIRRATSSEDIAFQQTHSGELIVTRTRPGHTGYQVFEDTIAPDGSKDVVQKAFDAAGNLVHDDPKGGTP